MVNNVFKKRFEMLKRHKGCRNVDIAEAMGVDKSQVSRYASGSMPKGEKLLLLALYFGVSVDWLIGADVPENFDFQTQEFLIESNVSNLTSNLNYLELKQINDIASDSALKERLMLYVQALAEVKAKEDNL